MADTQVYEKNLGAKSANSIGTSDYVRVVGSDDNSYKQPMNDIGKTILEKYTGSTLAGSAQSAKSAIDTLNSKTEESTMRFGTSIPSNSDLNDYTTPGVYLAGSGTVAQSLSNCPTTNGFRLEVKQLLSTTRFEQFLYPNNQTEGFYRRVYTGSWGDWIPDFTLSRGTAITSGADLNNFTAIGVYYSGSSTVTNSLAHCPITGVGFKLVVKETGYASPNFIVQEIYRTDSLNGKRIYCRSTDASGNFSDWKLQPSREEVDALNSNYTNIFQRMTGYASYISAVKNLDTAPTEAMCGTWWINIGSSDVTGTKPINSGQGILIILRQSTNNYRQTYIGVANNYGIWNRYYQVQEATWSSWTTVLDLTTKVGTLTVAEGVTDHLVIRQNGNVVSINGYVSGTFAANTNTTVGTISGVSLPNYTIRCRGGCGSNAYTTGEDVYIAINSSGSLVVNPASAGTNVYFSVTYIV